VRHSKLLITQLNAEKRTIVAGLAWSKFKDELVHEKEKFKAISDELDQTFAEMSGY